MNNIDLSEHNVSRLNQKEARRLDKLVEPPKAIREGSFQGYDASNGKYNVKLADGSNIQGKMISNGAVALGGKVQVTTPLNATPIIKGNPV